MGTLDGRVAFISGGARGMGRAHALALAAEGADIITFDLCGQIDSCAYPMATREDLETTRVLVEQQGRRVLARRADVRDEAAVRAVLAEGLERFGRLDVVVANAGIMPFIGEPARAPAAWHDALDVMLTGVLHTVEPAVPVLVEQGWGGSIVIISSTAGLHGKVGDPDVVTRGYLGYFAAKHGVVGLMRVYANALGRHRIRVNTVHPTGTDTPMVANAQFGDYFRAHPTFAAASRNLIPVPLVDPEDVAAAVVWLASDASRFVTATTLPVDAGNHAC